MSLKPVPASQSRVIMTEMVLPVHTNAIDSVFGGVIMSWIDIAAAISSQRHCGTQVVTASIDALNFVQPVYKGWIVNLRASVNFVANTSMEVGVRVDAEQLRPQLLGAWDSEYRLEQAPKLSVAVMVTS